MVEVLLEGFHAVKHALRFAPALVTRVQVSSPERAAALVAALAPDLDLSDAEVAPVAHHTGVQATAQRPNPDASVLSARSCPLVLLDAPRHHGNVGAVIRVCAAAGAAGVVIAGSLDPWAPAVLRGAAGLHYALPVLTTFPATGPYVLLDSDGDPTLAVPCDAVLVVGSERSGLSSGWRSRADACLALPMRPGVSSLNLATAVAAALYRGTGQPDRGT